MTRSAPRCKSCGNSKKGHTRSGCKEEQQKSISISPVLMKPQKKTLQEDEYYLHIPKESQTDVSQYFNVESGSVVYMNHFPNCWRRVGKKVLDGDTMIFVKRDYLDEKLWIVPSHWLSKKEESHFVVSSSFV